MTMTIMNMTVTASATIAMISPNVPVVDDSASPFLSGSRSGVFSTAVFSVGVSLHSMVVESYAQFDCVAHAPSVCWAQMSYTQTALEEWSTHASGHGLAGWLAHSFHTQEPFTTAQRLIVEHADLVRPVQGLRTHISEAFL